MNNRKRTIKKGVLYVVKRMNDPYYAGVAAELAFFFLLSIIPTVMLLGIMSGLFSVSLNFMVEFIKIYTPIEFYELISPYLIPSKYGNLSIIFFILSLWLASRGFFALIRISNYAYGIKLEGHFKLAERFKAMKITLLLIFMIIFGLLIVIYGRLIGVFISVHSASLFINPFRINNLWYAMRWPFAFIVFYWIMIYIYSRSINQKTQYKSVRAGALFSTIGILMASLIFSYYASNFARYDIIYGSLASVISLLLWFYLIGYVIVIGIHINIAYDKYFSKR